MNAIAQHDYIIVGGGLAGCVLAARLSEDPGVRVLLLEAGPEPRSLWIRMPAGMGRLFVNPTYNWGFTSESEAQLGGRAVYLPQGKTLGGSSAINGMAFVRGHPEDYDRWRDLGNPGWGWRDVLPYFRQIESRPLGASPLRGAAGPLKISGPRFMHPSSRAFVDAAVNAGLPRNADYNAEHQEGATPLQYTIHQGRRHAAAEAYLAGARARPNLTVITDAFVHRVVFRERRAVGVEFDRGASLERAEAGREVIVAGGAIGSPRVLLHSGIGPAAHLQALRIGVVADVPGVGSNLIDHPYIHMTWSTTHQHSLNAQLRGWRLLMHGARWLLAGAGPLTIGASQAAAFVRTPLAERPDIQINFRPISFHYDKEGRLGADPMPRLTAAICVLRPQSRGRIALKSSDPRVPPVIHFNYLSHETDARTLLAGIRWARRIFASEPLAHLVRAEDAPGTANGTDDDLLRFVHASTQTMAHPVGACRMGADDMAVVDEHLRVHGVEGLRVVDSSIMPDIVSGNTAAATFMIAEKGADLIRGKS